MWNIGSDMAESIPILITFLVRASLIALFLPFSALDKVLNHAAAIRQARQIGIGPVLAGALIATGLCVEIICSIGVMTGIADRLAAFVFAGYCATTAVLYERFWACRDFTLVGPSEGRDVFWDFMKNFAVAGGFLLITFGTTAATVDQFFANPLSSSHSYDHSPATEGN